MVSHSLLLTQTTFNSALDMQSKINQSLEISMSHPPPRPLNHFELKDDKIFFVNEQHFIFISFSLFSR